MSDDEWVRRFRARKRLAALQDEWFGLDASTVLDLCELEREMLRGWLWRLDGIWRSWERDEARALDAGKVAWTFGEVPDEERELCRLVAGWTWLSESVDPS